MGSDYRSFWDNMAQDRESAYLAVAGLPFGQPATEESLSRHGRETAEIIANTLAIGPGHDVLEIGVGVGRIAEHIAPRCRTFHGIDVSANMIRIARERMAALPNATCTAHDKSDLSLFADSSLDRIFCQVVLIHLDREDAFNYMRESFRALRPGGLAWFQFYNLLHPRGFREFQFAVDYMVQKGKKTRGRVHCYTAAEVRFLVEQAGFKVRDDLSALAPVDQHFPYPIPDADWEFYLIATGEKPVG